MPQSARRFRVPIHALLAACVLTAAPQALARSDEHTPATTVEITSRGESGRLYLPASGQQLESDIKVFREHLMTLANPFFEGRAPGTNGNRMAADYLEFHFKRLGLKPAFEQATDPHAHEAHGAGGTDSGANSATAAGSAPSFRQTFEARPSERPGDSVRLRSQAASYTDANGTIVELVSGTDFNVIGHSASGEVTAPLVFVGYGVESESRKYRSIPEGASLAGKIAVVLRFEPMKEDGKSRWAEEGWSFLSGLELKLNAISEAGAAGIILVNPPGVDDPRGKTLGDINSMASRRHQKIPVAMLSTEAADRLIQAADEQGRNLLALRTLADELPEGESGVIELPKATATIKADVERIPLMTDNVGAVLQGFGELKDQYVVIGAHYDHVGYGYFSSRGTADERGVIHAGADDNASGTSGMLLAAEKLSKEYAGMGDTPHRSVLFLGFSAEESGLEGSKFYVKHAIAEQAKHTLMINLDMIGRFRDGRLDLQGTKTAEGLTEWLQPYTDNSEMSVALTPGGSGPSDHASFYGWGVPVLFFFTRTHAEYHTPQDTWETINFEGGARIADLVSRIALDAAKKPDGFKYVGMGKAGDEPAQTSMRGTRVRFGIAPGDYSGSEKGVLIGTVYPNTPAEKAGLQKDDILTHWNGKELLDVEGWMPMLSEANPGDRVVITYKRKVGDHYEERTADVELTARQGATRQ